MVEIQGNGSAAPSELTRHTPFYRFMGTAIAALTLFTVVLSALGSNSWVYPALTLPALGTSCLAMAGALSVWYAKPQTVSLGRQKLWNEYVYTNLENGKTMTTAEYVIAGQPIEGIRVWCYIGSSYVMGFGLLALLSLVATIIGFGYLNNPI